MKKLAILALVILTSITQTHVAEAATSLKVTVREGVWIWLEAEWQTHVADDPEALAFKKKINAYAKTSKAKSQALAECKTDSNYYNTRVKVLDARNGTSGLGNLKSVTVSNMKVTEQIISIPDYTYEEKVALVEKYGTNEEDYPDWIEDGYVSYYIDAICSYVGIISLTTSNAYKIYVAWHYGEYSRAELSKKKWAITFDDD
jgi:hypothetical protein